MLTADTSRARSRGLCRCTHSGEPERYPFPGSPFPITVSADKNMVVTEKIDASGVRPHDYRIDLSVFDDAQKKWGP